MKRSLVGLVVALSLSACSEEPRGQLEPIPRPPGLKEPPKPEAAAKPTEPPVDPSKLALRWKVAEGAPITYQLTLELGGAAASDEPAPAAAKDKKGKGKEAPKEKPAATTASTALPGAFTFVLEQGNSGDYKLRVIPTGKGAVEDLGTVSERGFVLDGLQGVTRNLATLVLELPHPAVGPQDTWQLGTELLTHGALGPQFAIVKEGRRNRVKLASLTPGEDGEQVARVEYDVIEQLQGKYTPRPKPPTVPARGGDEEESDGTPEHSLDPVDANAEVKIVGVGEFLVKAGRWRTWEGSISTTTKGPFPVPALQVPPGTLKLRLTALEAPPPPATPTAKPQP
ncbi:hypothetical protein LZ198_04615 [Myxococcus sp. K15C18031901]|uniref:hypothetical protein n=1 Tax=Myxococcus dinghuensis TaxID=2906761 RepID=UPI0020A78C80|nr:hypothetical protein [Myxococcus dinghuensis]MCP3098159.1 hypothetical protein [Myxococcus dinghuensis]